jgi:uncharacterized protein YbjQ (UPF0145 family)
MLRRCSECRNVSMVSSLQRNGEPWECVWCHAVNAGFRSRRDPAEATLSDLGADMAKNHLAFERPAGERGPADTTPVLMVTTNAVPGYRITAVHGDVFGLTVRSRGAFGNFAAGLQSTFGGEIPQYTKLLTDSRNQARERLWREARERGGNAVVAMRFDTNEIGDIMSEVVAYGTAVTVEPDLPPAP